MTDRATSKRFSRKGTREAATTGTAGAAHCPPHAPQGKRKKEKKEAERATQEQRAAATRPVNKREIQRSTQRNKWPSAQQAGLVDNSEQLSCARGPARLPPLHCLFSAPVSNRGAIAGRPRPCPAGPPSPACREQPGRPCEATSALPGRRRGSVPRAPWQRKGGTATDAGTKSSRNKSSSTQGEAQRSTQRHTQKQKSLEQTG